MNLKLLFLIGLLGLSACSQVETTEDKSGADLMTTGGDEKNGFYERDLDDTRYNTNQNPNFIDLTESRPNLGTDQDKIRDVINTFPEVTPGSVYVVGTDAWVTVHSTKKFSEEDRDQLRHKLLKDITKAMPRYHIHIRIHDGDGE
ncbi:hypothetical protein ACFSCX_01145 [Bacillus salitolerans]|uniref:Sporulation protein n=1 Tax=Bacillus salitolerans TaxID=1437434 RepID=A0ABW4LK80_9BACI